MVLRLLLQKAPRALILASEDHALIFRKPPASSEASTSAAAADNAVNIVVEFLPIHEVDVDNAVVLNAKIYGCLGVLSVSDETFICVVSSSTSLGSQARHLPGVGADSISRVLSVDFYCLTSSTYDSAPGFGGTSPDGYESYDEYNGGALGGLRTDTVEHPCTGVRKILSNGSFYFSGGERAFDISTRLEARLAREAEARQGDTVAADEIDDDDPSPMSAGAEYDTRFIWNTFLIAPLLRFRAGLAPHLRTLFDQQSFAVMIIQGFCGVFNMTLAGQPAVLTLISRLGFGRAGTRFNMRGLDDDGNCANFVETETILRTPSSCFSYVQVRGSVPLFWEELGVPPFGLTITITRPQQASIPAFQKHFVELLDKYSAVHIVDLLAHHGQESTLSRAYADHVAISASQNQQFDKNVHLTAFDFHAKNKAAGLEALKAQLGEVLQDAEEAFGTCIVNVDEKGQATLVMGQKGVFRTNCKDCLDRTNVVQDVLSRFALEGFIQNTRPNWASLDGSLWSGHRVLWAENGDALSKIYAGTGAINTSFTRSGKTSFAGLLSNVTKSVNRMYQANISDSGKQKAIEALLGNLSVSQRVRIFNPIHDALRHRLRQRSAEFTSYDQTTIWAGTYNLNGRPGGGESLLPWLFPSADLEPSFLVCGFQEMVPLVAQQIMATDPEPRRKWEAFLTQTLATRPNAKSEYLLLRSGQLVGTALVVFMRADLVNDVRNVEATTKKTGLKGITGNKGAVALRLDYKDTSICFVTAHLAAGHANIDERIADIQTITDCVTFKGGKTMASHDIVIWAADTNFHINLPNETVRHLAQVDDFGSLMDNDQLRYEMRTGRSFKGFKEGPLLFRPTYKYDLNSDTYDSSEKNRAPAWTDRILYSGDHITLDGYFRAELRTSDHRPVYALLRPQIRTINHEKRSALRKQILQDIVAHGVDEKLDDKLARQTNGFASADVPALNQSSSGLPPPSDDRQAWWDVPQPIVSIESLGLSDPLGAVVANGKASSAAPADGTTKAAPPPIPAKPSSTAAASASTTTSYQPYVPRPKPPVPPSRSSSSGATSLASLSLAAPVASAAASSATKGRPASVNSSLMDSDDEEGKEGLNDRWKAPM